MKEKKKVPAILVDLIGVAITLGVAILFTLLGVWAFIGGMFNG